MKEETETLTQTVALLEALLVETQNLVFGKELEKPEQSDNIMSDRIQSATSKIAKATEDIKRINRSLQAIG